MMYLGSKNRYAKFLLPFILKHRDNRTYVEPFVGGFNMICKVNGNRIGSDNHFYLIELFKALQKGWIPPLEVSEELYLNIKNNKEDYEPSLVGFVGFICCFGARFFEGYARSSCGRNYALVGYRSITKQLEGLIGIDIRCEDFLNLDIPKDSLIYCDPPYEGTKGYSKKSKNNFNTEEFWNWVREKSKTNIVYISEIKAPEDFICIFEKQRSIRIDLKKDTNKHKTNMYERLFIHESMSYLHK